MGILDELIVAARARVEAAKAEQSFETISHDATVKALNQKATANLHRGGMSHVRGASGPRGPLYWFGQVLEGDEVSLLCEIKKASPTAGAISLAKPLPRLVAELEQAGVVALCYVTEPTRYGGSFEEFAEIETMSGLPRLRRDVIVDEYQLHESKLMDAAAVTLSCAVLDGKTLEEFIKVCDLLGMDAFVEVHDEKELQVALDAGARIIAVDARDPQTGEIDDAAFDRLSTVMPLDCTFVAMSGIQSADEVEALVALGVDAVMIGEALLRASFTGVMVNEMRYAAKKKREEIVETVRGTKMASAAGAPPTLPGAPGSLPGVGVPAAPSPLCPPAPGGISL